MASQKIHYVVIGGGIAGVTCVETLSVFSENADITLVSASPLIKTVTNYTKLTQVAETFDVAEKPLKFAEEVNLNVRVVHAVVTSFCSRKKVIHTSDGQSINYDKLCICTGGRPRLITEDNPFVIGIRDTESVKDFQKKVKTARRLMIVGNGGIATELVYELEGCEVIWAIKDKSIAHTFVDAGAGEFFLEYLNKAKDNTPPGPSKRLKYTTAEPNSDPTFSTHGGHIGGALGPDWTRDLKMKGHIDQISHQIHVERQVEVSRVMSPAEYKQSGLEDSSPWPEIDDGEKQHREWPVFVQLTNGHVYGCDLVVSATGVIPNTSFTKSEDSESPQYEIAEDGGIKVNSLMKTSEPDIFAAGDVCTACWEQSRHWLQMRLWSQARQMGCYAAKCMIADIKGEDISLDFCFELFAHVTTFFRFKVVLLGCFNGQGLSDDHEILLRVTKGEEYVKALLQDGRLVGAVLVGETDLEETFENLILNGLDLTAFKDDLLEPGIDIEDFFD